MKKEINDSETVGTEDINLTLKDVVEFTGISIRTEPMTDDYND